MTAPVRNGSPGYPRLGALRRRGVALFAALCLASGWLHVWQHHAAHEAHDDGRNARAVLAAFAAHAAHEHDGECDDAQPRRAHGHGGGHFDSDTSDLCQLADNPWVDLPAPPDSAWAPRDGGAGLAPAGAAVAGPVTVPPIRGPPSA